MFTSMATTTTTSCSLNRLLGEDDDISFFTLFFFTPLFESDVGRFFFVYVVSKSGSD